MGIYYLTVLEIRSLKGVSLHSNQGVGKVGSFWRPLKDNWFYACLLAFGGHWQSLAFLGLYMYHCDLCLHCHIVFSFCATVYPLLIRALR